MSKHTPGPLGIVNYGKDRFEIQGPLAPATPCKRVAIVDRMEDATLYVAAPGMLSALEAIAGMATDESTHHEELSALCIAIARTEVSKAQGATHGE